MDQQRMLNQEEQRRILEENAQREQTRIQRMEIIQEIADLERERDRTTNRLRRSCNQTLSKFNFGRMEDLYIALMDLDSRLSIRINDWDEFLDSDESGNPIYPDRGIPEYQYSPEAEDFSRKTKTMEEVLSLSQETLKKFLLSLSVADQHIVSLEAKITFLKNPKAWEADYLVPDGGQVA